MTNEDYIIVEHVHRDLKKSSNFGHTHTQNIVDICTRQIRVRKNTGKSKIEKKNKSVRVVL